MGAWLVWLQWLLCRLFRLFLADWACLGVLWAGDWFWGVGQHHIASHHTHRVHLIEGRSIISFA